MMKWFVLTGVALMLSAPANAEGVIELTFKPHLQFEMVEQHVFVERMKGSGQLYRVPPADQSRYLNSPVYAAAEPIIDAPLTLSELGPYRKGKALGFTLRDWESATGIARYRCDADVGTMEATFDKLVPNAVYSMWYSFLPRPPLDPFVVLNLPLGARDGSQAPFKSDAKGHADYKATFSPCLQLSGKQLDAVLSITWHSDGRTHGASPGALSTESHVHLLAGPFPVEGR